MLVCFWKKHFRKKGLISLWSELSCALISECSQIKDCPRTPTQLQVPLLPPCLPTPLSSVTWTLRPPPHGTVELASPTGLKQSFLGQPCNDSIVIKVAEGGTVGDFCPKGAIQKIQIHTSVSVTVSGSDVKAQQKPVLYARMKEEISGNKKRRRRRNGKNVFLWSDLIVFSTPSQKDIYSLYLQRGTHPSLWLLLAGQKECRITPPSLGSSLSPKGWRLTWCLLTSASPSAATATPTSGCRESAVGRRTTAAERTRRPRVRSSSPRASTSTCPTVCPKVEASASSPRSPCRRALVSGHLSGLFEGLHLTFVWTKIYAYCGQPVITLNEILLGVRFTPWLFEMLFGKL